MAHGVVVTLVSGTMIVASFTALAIHLHVSATAGVCKVHSDKMLTFDGVPLVLPVHTSETPSSRCKVLLAQDCSPRGLFSVSGSFKFGRWSVQLVVPSYELELVPQSSSFDSVVLMVNGQQMRISSSVPVELPSLISSRYSKRSTSRSHCGQFTFCNFTLFLFYSGFFHLQININSPPSTLKYAALFLVLFYRDGTSQF